MGPSISSWAVCGNHSYHVLDGVLWPLMLGINYLTTAHYTLPHGLYPAPLYAFTTDACTAWWVQLFTLQPPLPLPMGRTWDYHLHPRPQPPVWSTDLFQGFTPLCLCPHPYTQAHTLPPTLRTPMDYHQPACLPETPTPTHHLPAPHAPITPQDSWTTLQSHPHTTAPCPHITHTQFPFVGCVMVLVLRRRRTAQWRRKRHRRRGRKEGVKAPGQEIRRQWRGITWRVATWRRGERRSGNMAQRRRKWQRRASSRHGSGVAMLAAAWRIL